MLSNMYAHEYLMSLKMEEADLERIAKETFSKIEPVPDDVMKYGSRGFHSETLSQIFNAKSAIDIWAQHAETNCVAWIALEKGTPFLIGYCGEYETVTLTQSEAKWIVRATYSDSHFENDYEVEKSSYHEGVDEFLKRVDSMSLPAIPTWDELEENWAIIERTPGEKKADPKNPDLVEYKMEFLHAFGALRLLHTFWHLPGFGNVEDIGFEYV